MHATPTQQALNIAIEMGRKVLAHCPFPAVSCSPAPLLLHPLTTPSPRRVVTFVGLLELIRCLEYEDDMLTRELLLYAACGLLGGIAQLLVCVGA